MSIRYKHVRAGEVLHEEEEHYRPLAHHKSSKRHRVVVERTSYDSDSSPSSFSTRSPSSRHSDRHYDEYCRHDHVPRSSLPHSDRRYEEYYRHGEVHRYSPSHSPMPLKSALKKTSGTGTSQLEEHNVFNDLDADSRDRRSERERYDYDYNFDYDNKDEGKEGKEGDGDDDWDRIKEWEYSTSTMKTRSTLPSPLPVRHKASPQSRTSSLSYTPSRIRSVSPSPVRSPASSPARSYAWERDREREREYRYAGEPRVRPREAFRRGDWDAGRQGSVRYVVPRDVRVGGDVDVEREVRVRRVKRTRTREEEGEWKPLRGWKWS